MKINSFLGDLTDISAKKEPLPVVRLSECKSTILFGKLTSNLLFTEGG